MSEKQAQLTLDFQHKSRFSKRSFINGSSNASARTWLSRNSWPENRLWLWGPPGTGKTHLLQIWSQTHHVPFYEASEFDHAKLSEILEFDESRTPIKAIIIDHLDDLKDEVSLLHLINRAYQKKIKILMAARQPPAWGRFTLPDLTSRLKATLTTYIEEPEDKLRATLLLSLLAERQLVVPQPVTDWLWRRLPRTGEALVEAVSRLDQAALAKGVSISRPLALEVLADLLNPESQPKEEK
ncbi:AAA family ATPase [Aristophania vespae]|uniref:AAA family ATPase n=1 Tax=Aristophania vespae TaxID=2697033 RepID=A0A6P1NIC9_9PROT|nr:DnaA/Hda family protein [Aristophania vespae]QHI95412.1 AAA family ATPase [Aristophania vespae]UMM64696.1 Chromosomal replication initiator protein DnaA [Aristophania vespae]